jgi:AcrR family transcriptional regulator
MGDDRQAHTFDAIVRIVQDLLESKGYDAVQLRVVAKRARVSLTTIYKFFPTRSPSQFFASTPTVRIEQRRD